MGMKIHYIEEDCFPALCGVGNNITGVDDYKQVTCLKCIQEMDESERAWHDENNSEWKEFVGRSDKWAMVDDDKAAKTVLLLVGVVVGAVLGCYIIF